MVGRVGGSGVVVVRLVPCSGHEENPSPCAGVDRVTQGRRQPAAAPAVVGGDDVDAKITSHAGGVVDRRDRSTGAAAPRGVEKLERHDGYLPIDAHHADAVVAHRTDRARHVRAVAVVVHRVGIIIGEVPAHHVVDEAVAVVVDAVAGHLAGIAPGVGREIRVVVVHAGIDDGDNHAARASGRVPRLRRVDIGIDDAARLSGVVEAPELAARWIVGSDGGRDREIGLDIAHACRPCGPAEHVLCRCSGGGQRIEAFTQGSGMPRWIPCGGEVPAGCGRRRGGPHDPGIRPRSGGLTMPFNLPEGGCGDISRHRQPRFEEFRRACRGTTAASDRGTWPSAVKQMGQSAQREEAVHGSAFHATDTVCPCVG